MWPDSYFNLESYQLTYDRIKEESNYFCDKYAGKKYCEESKLLYTKATTSSALLFYYFGLYAMTGDTRGDSAFTWSLNAQMADDEAGTSCEERPYDTCGKVYLILRLRVSPPTCERILNALKENPVRQYTAHVGYDDGTWFLRDEQKRNEFNVHDFCNRPSTTAQTNGKLSNFHIQLYLE